MTPGSVALTSKCTQQCDPEIKCKPNIDDFWNVEALGITDDNVNTDDIIANENFNKTLMFENGRYSVKWPWKSRNEELPENRELAHGLLKSTLTRLRGNPNMFKKYNEVIEEQLSKGVIEKVERDERDRSIQYIPHHAVITPLKSTTKLRVVYDASAKTRSANKSLNECLFRGPVLLHDLCGMLLRFRIHPIAIVADIEKAFLQIGLQKDQREVTRFLWVKDSENPFATKENTQEYRFKRIPLGVISSPFILGATLNFHLDSYNNLIAQQLKRDIYIDNLITGCDSVADACSLYNGAKTMFKEA